MSNRANYLSDILASAAARDIIHNLPLACADGSNIKVREIMLNASMTAGLAFTNVSLGIVHSMAHTLGGIFHLPHGLADAIILPYIIDFNSADPRAKSIYDSLAKELGGNDLAQIVRDLNSKVGIASCIKPAVADEAEYMKKLDIMADMASADGCTKTNPIIPSHEQMAGLFKTIYCG